ncbi:MAG: hypothetical protein U0939_03705 [Pirellulales bacterium]
MASQPSTLRPAVVVIGDGRPVEFSEALADLERRSMLHRLDVLPHERELAAAVGRMEATPNVVVLLQQRPGEWTAARVEQVHARWPLARLVMLLGSWCEGEPRTGRPPPGVARVYWHQWAPQSGRYWDQQGQGPHPWNLPRSHSPLDVFLETSTVKQGGGELIAIEAADESSFDSLAETLARAGYCTARWRSQRPGDVRGASVLIWDDPGRSRHDLLRLRECCESAGGTPVIAMSGMLRWDDWQAARRWGVAHLLAKPFDLEDLLWCVRIPVRNR